MKRKTVLLFALLPILVLAATGYTAEPDLTLGKIELERLDGKTLLVSSTARNETSQTWIGWIAVCITDLNGKTLFKGIKKAWVNVYIRSGEEYLVTGKVPFRKIKAYDTVIVKFYWYEQEEEKQFEVNQL